MILLNNTLGIRNGSDDNCKKCCDTMQSGKNISDSVSNETYTAEEVNVLPGKSNMSEQFPEKRFQFCKARWT
jgi:hypothetical protein